MQAAAKLTVLNRDPECSDWLRPSRRLTVLKEPDVEVAAEQTHVFVMARASELEHVAEFVREASRRHHLKALLVHADLDGRWIGHMLDRAELRTLRNLLVHRGSEQPRRVLGAWSSGSQDLLIADAVALPEGLMVLSCSLERIEVPWGSIPALQSLGEEARRRFEVASDGSYINWPEGDVHLDLDALRVAIDPVAQRLAQFQRQERGRRFGQALAELRKRKGLTQGNIEGLSSRQVRRIENGDVLPRTATLKALAQAHKMDVSSYLNELAMLQHKMARKA